VKKPGDTTIRKASVHRKTSETEVSVTLDLDGSKKSEIDTGIGFMDHMLTLFAFHGRFDLELTCKGDLQVDSHHTMEDVGLALGQTFRKALGPQPRITRFAFSFVPMDESLSRTVIDISGRPYLVFVCTFGQERLGELETETVKEFFKAFAQESKINLHIVNLFGENDHHKIESIFKSFGRALSEGCREVQGGVPSTKGVL
jgi:imidazoleglycerol-phosphate dehydratase